MGQKIKSGRLASLAKLGIRSPIFDISPHAWLSLGVNRRCAKKILTDLP